MTIDPDAPWLANLVFALLVTALVTWGSVRAATHGQRKQAAADRDDLDAKVDGLSRQIVRVIDAQQATREDIQEARRDIGGLRADARSDRSNHAELRRRVDRLAHH